MGGVKRWICYLLSLLRLHSPECEHCGACEGCWVEIKKRLDDLNRAA